jgi:hypothetical protein
MLFDLAQTSRVSPRKSERLYASCDLRKSPLSASKKDVPNYQKEMCSLSCFFVIPIRAASSARKSEFFLRRQRMHSLRLTLPAPGDSG